MIRILNQRVLRKSKLLFILLLCIVDISSYAQDPQFSQFFAAPMYLNPGFTGATREHRIVANYRNQWPSMSNGYATYSISYDYNMKDVRSGFGLLVTKDMAGTAQVGTTNVGFLYSYKLKLSDSWMATPGLHFAYGNRGINVNKIVLLDQLAYGEANIPSNDPLVLAMGNTHFFDFGSGMLLYNKALWIGFSAYHLNKPNMSLIGDESRLPVKTSIHGGARIPILNGPFKSRITPTIAPSFIFKKQGNINQFDAGMNFHYSPIMVGFWYRGIPIVKEEHTQKISQDALIFLLGLKYNQFEFGYSYDITLSSVSVSAGGAHEVSLAYNIAYPHKRKPKRKDKFIPCPTFLLAE